MKSEFHCLTFLHPFTTFVPIFSTLLELVPPFFHLSQPWLHCFPPFSTLLQLDIPLFTFLQPVSTFRYHFPNLLNSCSTFIHFLPLAFLHRCSTFINSFCKRIAPQCFHSAPQCSAVLCNAFPCLTMLSLCPAVRWQCSTELRNTVAVLSSAPTCSEMLLQHPAMQSPCFYSVPEFFHSAPRCSAVLCNAFAVLSSVPAMLSQCSTILSK